MKISHLKPSLTDTESSMLHKRKAKVQKDDTLYCASEAISSSRRWSSSSWARVTSFIAHASISSLVGFIRSSSGTPSLAMARLSHIQPREASTLLSSAPRLGVSHAADAPGPDEERPLHPESPSKHHY